MTLHLSHRRHDSRTRRRITRCSQHLLYHLFAQRIEVRCLRRKKTTEIKECAQSEAIAPHTLIKANSRQAAGKKIAACHRAVTRKLCLKIIAVEVEAEYRAVAEAGVVARGLHAQSGEESKLEKKRWYTDSGCYRSHKRHSLPDRLWERDALFRTYTEYSPRRNVADWQIPKPRRSGYLQALLLAGPRRLRRPRRVRLP